MESDCLDNVYGGDCRPSTLLLYRYGLLYGAVTWTWLLLE